MYAHTHALHVCIHVCIYTHTHIWFSLMKVTLDKEKSLACTKLHTLWHHCILQVTGLDGIWKLPWMV